MPYILKHDAPWAMTSEDHADIEQWKRMPLQGREHVARMDPDRWNRIAILAQHMYVEKVLAEPKGDKSAVRTPL